MGSEPLSSAQVPAFFEALERGSAGLLIDGPAGIGKSYRYKAVREAARDRGWLVLEARPAEAETRLGGCGLIDLLADVSDDDLAALPGPQHKALAVALLREVSEDDPDPQVIAVALTTLVRRLAERRRLLVAVDDIQWLDAATASALNFLVRRLPTSGVGVLAALRTPAEVPSALTELDARGTLTRFTVQPLSSSAIAELVEQRVGLRVPAPVLARAAATSAGNPFYAVELARTWTVAAEQFLDTLPVPDSLQALVGVRITMLSQLGRQAVTAAAGLSRPTLAALRALGLDSGLPEAERAGVIEVSGGDIRFTHPLLSAAAYDSLTGSERAQLHRLLAEVEPDIEARARHLALASDGPDAALAELLDRARAAAERRGDRHAALDLVRLALHVSPAGDPLRPQRRLHLGRLSFRVGDTDTAHAEYDDLAAAVDTPPAIRARALISLSEITFTTVSEEAAVAHGQRAVDLAETLDDPELQADAHLYLAQAIATGPEAHRHAARALELAESVPVPKASRVAGALVLLANAQFNAGDGLDVAAIHRAIETERSADVPAEDSALGVCAALLCKSDEVELAADLLATWRQKLTDEGDDAQLPFLHLWETSHAFKIGDLGLARRAITQHGDAAERLGQQHHGRYARANLARLTLMLGDLPEAKTHGEALCKEGEQLGMDSIAVLGWRVLGEASVYAGEYDLADRAFEFVQARTPSGPTDPSAMAFRVLHAESLAALGRTDEATRLVDAYERDARRLERASALGLAARSRALIAVADGRTDEALDLFDEALNHYGGRTAFFPFDRARTLYLKGACLRRVKRKAAAKQTLTDARAEFVRLGAPGWIERTDGELARVGLRPEAPRGLTPTEARVAELAATGMTARDVAAALFLSPRTVEDNLGRAYRKLGIGSRAELGARLDEIRAALS